MSARERTGCFEESETRRLVCPPLLLPAERKSGRPSASTPAPWPPRARARDDVAVCATATSAARSAMDTSHFEQETGRHRENETEPTDHGTRSARSATAPQPNSESLPRCGIQASGLTCARLPMALDEGSNECAQRAQRAVCA